MVLFLSINTVKGLAAPEASPLQPVNWKPIFGVAVNCTELPLAYVGWFGFLVTEPFVAFTVNVNCIAVKVAVMFLLLFITTVNGLFEPVASTLHPVNIKPGFGVAVSCTEDPVV